MSIDAMHWVWTRSRTKGNVRLVVLAIADKAPDAECTTRMGMTELIGRLNASRSTVQAALDKALESGEVLEIEAARGSRPAAYQLPLAVGHTQSESTARGPESGPVLEPARPETWAPSPERGPGIRAGSSEQGRENRAGSETARGPESGPHNQTISTKNERAIDAPAAAGAFPDFARPLSDQLALAEVNVRWPFTPGEWLRLEAAIKRSGIPALVDYARRVFERQRGDVDSARYFLRGWCELPPMPSPTAERPPLRAVGSPGWQPYSNPTDPAVYENGWN